jgi:hypothetical protein
MNGLDRARRIALAATVAGLVACAAGAFLDTTQFLRSYLWSYWFWVGAAVGCGQLLMLYHLVGGGWGFVTQRILEAALRTIPFMAVLAIPLIIGIPRLYRYAHPDLVAADKALAHKAVYLNLPFVTVRLVLYFVIWGGIGYLLSKWSQRLDETGDLTYHTRRVRLSAPGIIIFSFASSFAIIDWIMALEPDWYSTMFPGFYLVGQVLTALGIAILTLRLASRTGPLANVVTPRDYHDLGNLLWTFVILWAYVEVSQLVITWSGNLPKEITWYLHRTRGNWAWLTVAIALFHFAVPFFILLGRRNKLRARRLAAIAALVVLVHLVENFWNVAPAFHDRIHVSWLDFAAPVAIGGIWVMLFLRQLARRPLVPVHDPRLEEVLERA